MTDETKKLIEQRANKGRRVTPADVEASVKSEHYFTAAQGVIGCASELACGTFAVGEARPIVEVELPTPLRLLTFCVLTLQNGFTVTGESSCAAPENYDKEIGQKVARQNAVNKIWPLLGYMLRDELHNELNTASN